MNTFNFLSLNKIRQPLFVLIAIGCSLVLQSFSIEKEDTKIKSSTVTWVGSKVTGSHEGTVDLKSGSLEFDNKALTGGEFVIDMSSIICTDLSGKGKASIERHLKSDDFFSVEEFPTANLKIVNVKKKGLDNYLVSANITIKDVTQVIEFETTVKGETAQAKLIIDRTEFGIIYKSGNFFEELADKAIYDEFEMTIKLKF
ncbi:YceI family protein [Flavobacteriales bacterium]|jgi:polyisoprenoid-binding protein YceI|nr:YceI family protein [Flavobacteriales bacterium]